MEPQQKIDTKGLEQKIGSLKKNLGFLNDSSGADSNDLFKIVHRPGWTTPQQVGVAVQILEAMNQQAAALQGLKDALQKHVEASGAK
jgi:hypothetical protein